jgi:hypothetical protein
MLQRTLEDMGSELATLALAGELAKVLDDQPETESVNALDVDGGAL